MGLQTTRSPAPSARASPKTTKSSPSSDSFAKVESNCSFEYALSDSRNCGITLHYFASGFVTGAVNAIFFDVLAGYLNVSAAVMQGGVNLAQLPTVFSIVLGILSDSWPICGLRRRPYMLGGWLLAAACSFCLMGMGLPGPYYCFSSEEDRYLFEQAPCNPDAVDFYVPLMVCVCGAQLGITAAGSAANGLMVEYAKAEAEENRGRAQTLLQMVNTAGYFVSVTIVAFGFNGRMFTGSFNQRHQLSYQEAIGIVAVMCTVTGALCAVKVHERPGGSASLRDYSRSSWHLLESKAFCAVALFFFASSSIFNISTTARVWVGLEWAKTENMQRQLCGMLGACLSLLGSWLIQKWFLGASWRKIIFVTGVSTTLLDAIPQFCTIFDVIRNQYFYLGEPVTQNVPQAMSALVTTFLINELADDSNCALVAGLMDTIAAVAQRLSVVLSNQVFSVFTPSLSDRMNYIEDTQDFRWTVASSFLLSYFIYSLCFLALPLLPAQKGEARERKQTWCKRPVFAMLATFILGVTLLYTLIGDFLVLDPSLTCLHFLGGQGC
ncbi:nipblb [Symbiodinium sp. CCMP2592]|nr:nipblb [Symbiodinium sp. CCMP2592]